MIFLLRFRICEELEFNSVFDFGSNFERERFLVVLIDENFMV